MNTKTILAGCDLHEKNMVLKVAVDAAAADTWRLAGDRAGREKLLARLKTLGAEVGASRIILAYEASCLGYVLYDHATAAGLTCHVLAPSGLRRSPQERKRKNDDRDSELILQCLRGHVLAGNPLPLVCVPDGETRDARELLRSRLRTSDETTGVKTRMRCLLKRYDLPRPPDCGQGWTVKFQGWLAELCGTGSLLGAGGRAALAALRRRLEFFEGERERQDEAILRLAQEPRWAKGVQALCALPGVGVLTALVFLTEMGNLRRFNNRRQVAAYLGLIPCSWESGEADDRKGRITRQGPARVRRVLCQAAWNRLRSEPREKLIYEGIVARNPQAKKKAVVAGMRRLAVRMFYVAREAV